MAKKNLWLGMLVMALVFGMTVVGCGGDDDDGSGGGSPLNGTWVKGTSKLVINNASYVWWENNTPEERGTFSASGGNVTTKAVDVYYNNTWLPQAQAISTGNFTASDFMPFNGTYVLSNNNETLTISFWGTWIKSH